MAKKIISVILLCSLVLCLCACAKARTVEEAIENADAILQTSNNNAFGACTYESEAKRENGKDITYWVYARLSSAVRDSEYPDLVREMAIQEIYNDGYPKLEKEFEKFDVNVIVLIMDDTTLYCGIEDGEINYITD